MARKPRLGLALGSGAARGWAHIGIIRALERLGDEFFALAASQNAAPPENPRDQLFAATCAVFIANEWACLTGSFRGQISTTCTVLP